MKRLVAIVAALFTLSTAGAVRSPEAEFAGDVPRFVEQASSAGIQHVYEGPWEHFVGGGVATFDCNADRMPDLYVAGGANLAALFINTSAPGGDLSFEHRSDPVTDLSGVIGAYPIDIDGDGYMDLVVLRVGENRILRGGPDCAFTNANETFGVDGGREWSTAFSATFEPGLAGPTLAFGNYVDRTAPGSPWGTCAANVLWRPSIRPGLHDKADTANVVAGGGSGSGSGKAIGDGEALAPAGSTNRNSRLYEDALPLEPGHCALSMLFTDWNRSGRDALRITNDRQYYRAGEEQLWRLDGGRYPRLYGRGDGWSPLVIWGMGIAEGDLDADGYPEYALTSMGDTKLQSLDLVQATEENRPAYVDVAFERGATAHRPYVGGDMKPSTGWHSAFEDLNNDARLDLFITKGNVESMGDFAAFDPDNLLLATHDGRFVERGDSAGLALRTRGRGAAVRDLNADGLLDIVVVNRSAPLTLFRNTGMLIPATSAERARPHSSDPPRSASLSDAPVIPARPAAVRAGGNWLAIELRQPGPNVDAIGARLSIRTGNHVQTRRIQIGGGHASGGIGFVHVGLGVAERAVVRVQWPDGEWSAPYRLFANHHIVVTRGEDHVAQWFPPERRPRALPSTDAASADTTSDRLAE